MNIEEIVKASALKTDEELGAILGNESTLKNHPTVEVKIALEELDRRTAFRVRCADALNRIRYQAELKNHADKQKQEAE